MAHRQEKALHPMHESMMQRIQQMRGASIRYASPCERILTSGGRVRGGTWR